MTRDWERKAVTTRVLTADLALIDETLVGEVFHVPPGKGYIASAFSISGQPLGLPKQFDVTPGEQVLDVYLESREKSASAASDDSFFVNRNAVLARINLNAGDLSELRTQANAATEPPHKHLVVSTTPIQDGKEARQLGFVPVRVLESHVPRHGRVLLSVHDLQVGHALAIEFPGPSEYRRYAIVPMDLSNDNVVMPRVNWSQARTPGYFLPEFEFQSLALNMLQSALRHELPSARAMARKSFDGILRKPESPLEVALNGLVLLQDTAEPPKEMQQRAADLYTSFSWLPDALPLYLEILARLGRHKEAESLLDEAPSRGSPWTRRGLAILAERTSFYGMVRASKSQRAATWYQALLALTHPACPFCVFELESPNPISEAGSDVEESVT